MCNVIYYKKAIYTSSKICFGHGVCVKFKSKKCVAGTEFAPTDFDFVNKIGQDWQKGHMLGVRFGGLADAKNLLPMTQTANLKFKTTIEDKLALLLDNKPIIDNYLSNETSNIEEYIIKYNVKSSDERIIVNGYSIPASIYANIEITNSKGVPIHNDTLNNMCNKIGINVIFPLCATIETNIKKS